MGAGGEPGQVTSGERDDNEDKPKLDAININFTSANGIHDFAAYTLGSYSKARMFVDRARMEIVSKPGKLFGVSGMLESGLLQGRCRGTNASDIYEVEAKLDATDGADLDWAELRCTCPYGAQNRLCKHSLALLLCRLDRGAWVAAGGEEAAAEASQTDAAAKPDHRVAPAAAAIARAPVPLAAAVAGEGRQQPRKRRLPNLAGPAQASKAASLKSAAKPKANMTAGAAKASEHGGATRKKQDSRQGPAAGAASAAAAAAAGFGAGSAPHVIKRRMMGKRLLADSDEELVRQCREALAKGDKIDKVAVSRYTASAVRTSPQQPTAAALPWMQPKPVRQAKSQQKERSSQAQQQRQEHQHLQQQREQQHTQQQQREQRLQQAAPNLAAEAAPTAAPLETVPVPSLFEALCGHLKASWEPALAAAAPPAEISPASLQQDKAAVAAAPAAAADHVVGLSSWDPIHQMQGKALLAGAAYRPDSGNSQQCDVATQPLDDAI